ncbi:MAG TPA: protein kinase [Kofleriaceae bacterium]|jgi:serine/threonine protein kinase/WD40 repeat protein|nr:protein kinase [Kofleriaceae bacterium]
MAELDLSGRTLGEFVLREQIGAGGYGAVYRCEQPVLKRNAVVKILHAGRRRNNTAKERFLREAQLASRLDHPYAAHVYSFGAEDDGLLWIAMELVQGITLGDLLKSRGPMPLDQFAPFFECVAQVVQAAHERGIVHRDLKPSNIMVIASGDRLFPKLLDFGIAKLNDDTEASEPRDDDDEPAIEPLADRAATVRIRVTPQLVQRTRTDSKQAARLTHRGAVIGSAPYMSPEQWGDPCAVGPASDIYALGCVAYEALTGHAPFSAANTDEYYQQHLRADPPSLGTAFSPELDRVLQRALAKAPEARHASAPELAAEFRAVLRAQPREQLRSAAQHWQDRDRPQGLLWGREVLAEVERWAPPRRAKLSELECSFVAASQQRARRIRWARRALGVLAVAGALGALGYRSAMQADLAEQRTRLAEQQTRAAQQLAEVRVTQSELEQGRAALLHGEPEAQAHLTEAYRRDGSPSTAFMLARSMQPRLMEQAQFASSQGRMLSAAFAPDGAQIVTTDDRNAQLWDGRTYRLLRTLPHGSRVNHAAYGPGGAILVTAGEAEVRVWDPASGALIRELTPRTGGTPVTYFRVAISRDGTRIAAVDESGALVDVWDAATGAVVSQLRGRPGGFPDLVFSPDGWLATTNGDELRVFDAHTWRQVLTLPEPVHGVAFDAHSHLVTGTAAGDVAIWSVPGGARLQHLRPSGESVDAVAFSPDGERVVAGSRDGAVQIWHAATGTPQSQLNPRHSKILAVEFDPTSQLVLAASADGTVVVADAGEGLPIAVLDGPRNVTPVAHFDASSGRVVGASWDGTARVWDASSPYRRWASSPAGTTCNIGLGARPDTRFVAVGCSDLPTQVWDTAHDQRIAELAGATPGPGDDFLPAAPAVSVLGDRAAIARDRVVQVFELPGGRLLRTISHGAPVSAVAFAGAGTDLVTGAVDGSLIVTRDRGAGLVLRASGGIDAAEILADGKVVAATAQRRLQIYDPSGAALADLEMPARMISLRPDGARLVALPSWLKNTAAPVLVDLTRPRVVAQLAGHIGHVFSARWAPGGRIVTAGADGTARLWDGTSGQLVRIYRGGSRFLADAIIAFDGLLIGGDGDGVLRFWDVATGARLWTLQAHKSAVIAVHMEGADLVSRGFTGEISRWRFPRAEQVIDTCGEHPRCAIVAE